MDRGPATPARRRKLTQDRIGALAAVGEWRGTPDILWASRLEQVRQFRAKKGRFPVYTPQRRPEEKVLATWLHRQRTWARTGRLRPDRHQHLDRVLPGWTTPTR